FPGAELAVVQEQHHHRIERAVLRPHERSEVGMPVGERVKRRLHRGTLHIHRVDAADTLGKEVGEADPWHQAFMPLAIWSISGSNTAHTRSLRSEKNSRVTKGGTPRLAFGRSNTSDGSVYSARS